MGKKVVCYYCGTAYDEERGKCPLCGSTARSSEEAPAPVQRRRITDEERRQRRREAAVPPQQRRPSSGSARQSGTAQRKRKKKMSTRTMSVMAVTFLALAAFVLLYFIGDMIGWWPGLEDLVHREEPKASVEPVTCESLTLTPTTLTFEDPGVSKTLTVSVNPTCTEKVSCSTGNPAVATVAQTAETSSSETEKSVTFTVTAVEVGDTEITVQCGEKRAVCAVTVNISVPPTVEENYVPELNYDSDVSLYAAGETAKLEVTNLPRGLRPTWKSEDATIAAVGTDGTVTAVSRGTTRVTVDVGGKTAEVLIRCTFGGAGQEDNHGAHLEKTDVSVRVGESFDLYLYDEDGEHIDDITYTVKDEDICTVKNNYVTAVARGTTTVTVTYNGNDYECIVRVS